MAKCEIHPNSSFPQEWREDFEQIKSQIPTYQLKVLAGDEPWEKVSTLEDFRLLITTCGWESTADFTRSTGVKAEEMVDRFFSIVNNSIHFE